MLQQVTADGRISRTADGGSASPASSVAVSSMESVKLFTP
jgi:hypothetical protein